MMSCILVSFSRYLFLGCIEAKPRETAHFVIPSIGDKPKSTCFQANNKKHSVPCTCRRVEVRFHGSSCLQDKSHDLVAVDPLQKVYPFGGVVEKPLISKKVSLKIQPNRSQDEWHCTQEDPYIRLSNITPKARFEWAQQVMSETTKEN